MNASTEKVNTQYTIVLGAEGELGRAMAREIARKKCNLVLISTTSADLQRFAIGLQLREDVQVDAMKLDLADSESVEQMIDLLLDRYEVRALINNITCDWSRVHGKCISEVAKEDFSARFHGAVQITRGLIPAMVRLSSSYIQHIIPYPSRKDNFSPEMQQAVAKMYTFTRELDSWLRNTTVSVSLMHPSPQWHQEEEPRANNLFPRDLHARRPGEIALKAVNGMLRGDRLIIPGVRNRILFFFRRYTSSWIRQAEEGLHSSLQPSV